MICDTKIVSIKDIKKDYFCITFCMYLMRKMDINVQKFVCVGVKFLAFNVLLRIESEKKVIAN